jgi:phage regulator Rha-like protein
VVKPTLQSDDLTSQEIADLVGSRHHKVKQSIERLADWEVIQPPPMVEVKNSGGQTVRHFIFRGEQGSVTRSS